MRESAHLRLLEPSQQLMRPNALRCEQRSQHLTARAELVEATNELDQQLRQAEEDHLGLVRGIRNVLLPAALLWVLIILALIAIAK